MLNSTGMRIGELAGRRICDLCKGENTESKNKSKLPYPKERQFLYFMRLSAGNNGKTVKEIHFNEVNVLGKQAENIADIGNNLCKESVVYVDGYFVTF